MFNLEEERAKLLTAWIYGLITAQELVQGEAEIEEIASDLALN